MTYTENVSGGKILKSPNGNHIVCRHCGNSGYRIVMSGQHQDHAVPCLDCDIGRLHQHRMQVMAPSLINTLRLDG